MNGTWLRNRPKVNASRTALGDERSYLDVEVDKETPAPETRGGAWVGLGVGDEERAVRRTTTSHTTPSGGGGHQLGEQGTYPPVDLVADRANLVDALARGVV